MTRCVFRLRSTLELPLEDVHGFFEEVDLPTELEDVEITRRNNTLIIKAVAAEDDISKYTPTAQLKASVTENRIYETEDGWSDTPPETVKKGSRPQWNSFGGQQAEQEEEEEVNSKLIEYACFKGDRETVLQNTELQYPMFRVLCDLARHAGKGSLVAITVVDDRLEATRIIDGEERAASIEIVEDPSENDEGAVDWRNNEFIDS